MERLRLMTQQLWSSRGKNKHIIYFSLRNKSSLNIFSQAEHQLTSSISCHCQSHCTVRNKVRHKLSKPILEQFKILQVDKTKFCYRILAGFRLSRTTIILSVRRQAADKTSNILPDWHPSHFVQIFRDHLLVIDKSYLLNSQLQSAWALLMKALQQQETVKD